MFVGIDNEANDTSETAQTVVLPCEIAGRIEKRRDRDWYTFAARKDEVYSVEVLSDRLGSETDMYFVLRRADNKQVLVENDDNPDTLSPVRFFTRSEAGSIAGTNPVTRGCTPVEIAWFSAGSPNAS